MSLFGHAIQSSLALSDSDLGLLYGLAFIVPLALCSLVVGWAVDRYNRVLIVAFGLTLWSLMTAACGLVGSFPGLLLARGAVGAGEATLTPAAYSLIGDRFSPERRGRAVGIVAASVSVGAGASLLVGGAVLSLLGPTDRLVAFLGILHPWQLTFVILGMSGLPVAVLFLTVRDDHRLRSQNSANADPAFAQLTGYLRRNLLTFGAVLGAGAINVAVGTGVMAWAPTLLLRRFNTTPTKAGYLLGLATLIGGVIGPPLATELSDRRIALAKPAGRLSSHPYIFISLAAGTAILSLVPTMSSSIVGIVLVAASLGAINALSYAAVQDLAPDAFRGRMIALLQFVTLACGYAAGPSLVAFMTDHVFRNRQMLPMSLLTVACPLCIAGAALTIVARRAYDITQRDKNLRGS